MFCKKCGVHLEDGSIFCKKCGARLIDTSDTPNQDSPVTSHGRSRQRNPSNGIKPWKDMSFQRRVLNGLFESTEVSKDELESVTALILTDEATWGDSWLEELTDFNSDIDITLNHIFDYMSFEELVSSTIPSIGSFEGIECLAKLESLTVVCRNLPSLSPLHGLKNLKHLYICTLDTSFDMEQLSGFSNLESLVVYHSLVRGTGELSKTVHWKSVSIIDCHLTDISFMKNVVSESINLANNDIRDISPLINKLNKTNVLKNLILSNNNVSSIKGLSGANALQTLRVNDNQLSSALDIPFLPELTKLDIHNNSSLKSLSGLDQQPKLSTVECNIGEINLLDELSMIKTLSLVTLHDEFSKLTHNETNILSALKFLRPEVVIQEKITEDEWTTSKNPYLDEREEEVKKVHDKFLKSPLRSEVQKLKEKSCRRSEIAMPIAVAIAQIFFFFIPSSKHLEIVEKAGCEMPQIKGGGANQLIWVLIACYSIAYLILIIGHSIASHKNPFPTVFGSPVLGGFTYVPGIGLYSIVGSPYSIVSYWIGGIVIALCVVLAIIKIIKASRYSEYTLLNDQFILEQIDAYHAISQKYEKKGLDKLDINKFLIK